MFNLKMNGVERPAHRVSLMMKNTADASGEVISVLMGGARLFAANISFADHSPVEMQSRRYLVVTVESVLRFLEQMKLITQQRIVKLP